MAKIIYFVILMKSCVVAVCTICMLILSSYWPSMY